MLDCPLETQEMQYIGKYNKQNIFLHIASFYNLKNKTTGTEKNNSALTKMAKVV